MNRSLLALALCALSTSQVWAFPPAPAHVINGTVRDENGRPLQAGEGTIILSGAAAEITRAPSDPLIGVGKNYQLHVPMDANLRYGLYQRSSLTAGMPFTIKVIKNGRNYVPMQLVGSVKSIGQPGKVTRLDLTLGLDADGDGMPDAWEQDLADSDALGRFTGPGDIHAGDDLDKDGLTNLQEFLLGTYALDSQDGLNLEIVSVEKGLARMRFPAVRGRTYTIKASTDLQTWTPAPFALTSTAGAETAPSWRAEDTTLVDIYAPIGTLTNATYRLYAE